MADNLTDIAASLGLKIDCGGAGNTNARVAIVSDYPGEQEKRTGVPMSGSVGRFMWEQLTKYTKLTRNDVYVTNAIKEYHDTDNAGNKPKVSNDEFVRWRELLLLELRALQRLEYIIVLGGQALEALFGYTTITNWRGSVLEWEGKRCYIAYNPAYVGKRNKRGQTEDPMRSVIYKFDMRRVDALVNKKENTVEPPIETRVVRTMTDFNECMRYMRARSAVTDICLDIEHINHETCCVGLCADSMTGWVVPFNDTTTNLWSVDDELQIRLGLQQLLGDVRTKILGHYVASDVMWLWFKDRIRCGHIHDDTMLSHHALYSLLPHSLAFLTSQYTWHPYYKDEYTEWKTLDAAEVGWAYNAKDTVLTTRIHRALSNELREHGLEKFYRDYIMSVTDELVSACVLGVPVDLQRKGELDAQYIAEFNKKRADLEQYIHSVCGRDVNINSSKQLSELIYRDMKVVHVVRGKNCSSTAALILQDILDKPSTTEQAKDVINKLLTYREDAKFLSTNLGISTSMDEKKTGKQGRKLVDDDGVFRAAYSQTGTKRAPGRLSSSMNQWNTASNIQNQPPRARQMYVAPPGYVFVYIDSAQAEARLVGWYAEIEAWINEFEQARLHGGIDCHRALASRIFGVPYDEVPKKDHDENDQPTIRYIGKRARHGLNYRMQPITFAAQTGISLGMAIMVHDAYHRETPELRKWWSATEREVYDSKRKLGYGVLFNAFGRRLTLLQELNDQALETIVAFKPQSSLGDLLLKAWRKCHADPRWDTQYGMIRINVHDSLSAIVREDRAKACAAMLVQYAEEPMVINNRKLIIPAEAKISVPDEHGVHRWSNLKTLQL